MKHNDIFERVDRPLLTKPFIFFFILFVIGAYYIGVRFVEGIGAVSNMSDGYPWGIWIAYDVVVGTALGCGGYALGILIYFIHDMRFHPLIRSAILTSAFGYTLAGLAITIDVGRYWNIYGFLIPTRWHLTSVLLEVALCVMAYVLVLWIEMMPVIAEKFNVDVEKMERFVIAAASFGLLLPTMHQSSLGSIQLISTTKLSPIWHSGFLPLFFLSSCVLMGFAVVTFESLLSSLFFGRPYETHLLSRLAIYMAFIGLGWAIFRILVLIFQGAIVEAFSSGWLTVSFIVEILLFVIPSLLFISRKFRSSPRRLFILSSMYLVGGALYRFNVYLIGWNPKGRWVYFPSFEETMITVGLVSLEFLLYLIFVKKFAILPKPEHAK